MSEIELQSDVLKRQSQFGYNLMHARIQNSFQEMVDQRIDHPNLRVDTVFEDYFSEDKTFGAANKDHLMLNTLVCLAFCNDRRTPKQFKSEAFELSASMLWETAFIDTVESHNSPTTVDDRIELIDTGSCFLMHASTLTQKTDMEQTQRLLLRSLFTQAMRDIVSGEVTSATRDELLVSLRDARSQLKFIENTQARNGLLGEIVTLESSWSSYLKLGDKVAIPATIRGGSGFYRANETHDIDILRQRRDDSWIVLTPIEVKRLKITDKMRERYTQSHLAQVATDGTVSISGAHRQLAG